MKTQRNVASRLVTADDQADNANWIRRLRAEGPTGRAAQSDLRELLVKGLRRGLSSRPQASDMAEDFAQESLLRILDGLHLFRNESRFLTWALAIAMRVAFSTLRRKHWGEISLESLNDESSNQAPVAAAAEHLDGRGADSELLLARQEIFETLERCVVQSLTERQRRVVLAKIRGVPQAELAAQLGINRNALYKVCHDARRTLRSALEAAGYPADVVRSAFQ